MDEYIKREEAIEAVKHAWAKGLEPSQYIETIPASDVAPVRHGRWLNFYGDFSTAECDICAEIYEVSPDESTKKEFFDAFKEFYKFCPNCGAKMDGGAD